MKAALHTRPVVLSIAGSDSGGGAGIQADLRAFRARGVHGTCVITAITAQNTQGVRGVHPVPLAHIRSQIAAIFDDFPVAAVKVGMLGSRAVVRLVARELRVRRPAHCIIDPVMIATSGARLLDDNAIEALRDELIPLADVLTPNLPEAAALLNLEQPITSAAKANAAAAQLRALGARAVLLKGGHGLGKTLVDRLYDANGVLEIRHPRLRLQGHGTGCSLASALAAELAKGRTLRAATKHAVDYVNRGLRAGYQPGKADLTVLG